MHLRHDGVAVVDRRSSIAPAAGIDAFHDLEIGHCITRLRLLVATGFAMTLLSASLAFNWWGNFGAYDTAMGYLGIAIFGAITTWLIWLLPTERGPVVIVTPYGVRDLRMGNDFLPWDSIADISAEQCRGQKVIVLSPTPGLQRQLSCIHVGVQSDRIMIRSEGLATDFDTLLRACRACHAAGGQVAARS